MFLGGSNNPNDNPSSSSPIHQLDCDPNDPSKDSSSSFVSSSLHLLFLIYLLISYLSISIFSLSDFICIREVYHPYSCSNICQSSLSIRLFFHLSFLLSLNFFALSQFFRSFRIFFSVDKGGRTKKQGERL